MANPLSKLVEVDERPDGVYIKVGQSKKEEIQLGELINALRGAFVVNYNTARIREVFENAKEEFEKIGPPFELYNVKFDSFVKVNANPQRATMRISAESIVAGIKPTPQMIEYALGRNGIIFGIKKEVIREFLENAKYDTDLAIAEHLPPEKGVDGKIEIEVDLDPDATPKVDEYGKTDYRDIKTFVVAKKGQVLAKRIPPEEGKPGKSIFGEEIKSQIGKDVLLPAGKNTEISKDGQWLSTLKEGIVYMDSGLICVGEMLSIPGDVDFSVGNIKYTGDVVIKGNVKPGFIVESEGNIEIHGEVESAKVISRKGVVTIGRGVIGKDDTEIYGANGVNVSFSQGSTIKTDGKLTVDKYLLHCNSTCSVFESVKPASGVIGGSLMVYDKVLAVNIGNDSGVETDIFLVDKNRVKAKEKLEELDAVREKVAKQLEPVSRELKSKSMIIKRAASQATLKQKQELKKWVDAYNSLSMKIKYIEKKKVEIKEVMNSPANLNGFIKVKNTIFPGTKIDMYGISHKSIKNRMTNKVFRLIDSVIQAEG